MPKKLSKRKLESYQRAEIVARELRYQIASNANRNEQRLAELVINWMKVTGNIKYERPGGEGHKGVILK